MRVGAALPARQERALLLVLALAGTVARAWLCCGPHPEGLDRVDLDEISQRLSPLLGLSIADVVPERPRLVQRMLGTRRRALVGRGAARGRGRRSRLVAERERRRCAARCRRRCSCILTVSCGGGRLSGTGRCLWQRGQRFDGGRLVQSAGLRRQSDRGRRCGCCCCCWLRGRCGCGRSRRCGCCSRVAHR